MTDDNEADGAATGEDAASRQPDSAGETAETRSDTGGRTAQPHNPDGAAAEAGSHGPQTDAPGESGPAGGPVPPGKVDLVKADSTPRTTPAASTPAAPDAAVDHPAAEADDGPAAPERGKDPVPPEGTTTGRHKRRRTKKPRRKAPWWELPALVVLAIGIAILVKSFIVQPFYIPSDSMEKTLHGCPGCHGDRILVNKPVYTIFRDPDPGDVVVFDAPKGWDDEPTSTPPSNPIARAVRGFGQLVGFVPPDGQVLVKRVIAVGGQTVKGDAQGNVMISTHGRDGPYRTLREPYVYAPAAEAANQRSFGPVTIPKGRLWVMGDHRTDSADSRFHCSPGGPAGVENDDNCDPRSSTVPIDLVIGKAFVIAWPPSRWDLLGTPSTFESAAGFAGPALPGVMPLATVVPVFWFRRRSRRRAAR